jgi:NADH:ubiquinone oxidoreductase subunit C
MDQYQARKQVFAPDLPFRQRQEAATERLREKYATGPLAEGRKLDLDKLGEPVLWVKDGKDLILLVKTLKLDPTFKIDFLSDITAYDNDDHKDGPERFVVVYQLYSTTLQVRVRLKLRVNDGQAVPTLVNEWRGANWLEREVFDLFGIPFDGHPNLRRIMMDERFTGHPLRKEYHIKQREPFANNIPLHLGAHAVPKPQE